MVNALAIVLPSFAGGGAERVMLTLAARLNRQRFKPALIVLSGDGPLRPLVPCDVAVQDLGRPRLSRAMPALWRALSRRRPGLVLSTMGYLNQGLLAMKPLLPRGTRLVVREANLPALGGPHAPGRLMTWGYRRLYPRADAIICPAQAVARALSARYGTDPSCMDVIANPVDEADLRARASPIVRHPGPGLRIVASGRLREQKGFDRLIDMVATLPTDTHLTVLGQGPLCRALTAQAAALGLAERIALAGFQDNPWRYYAGADVFALPSRWEGMPNAALEALACGAPVVATPEAGGVAEIAAQSEAGAMTVAAAGPDFAHALTMSRAPHPGELRASLLPKVFLADAVVAAYEALLERVAA